MAEAISRVCQGIVVPVSVGYALSVFNQISILQERLGSVVQLEIGGW